VNSLENLYKMFCAPDEATASLKRSAEFGVELAIYQWRGINSIHSVADLQLRWGLDLVLPLPNDGPLAAIGDIEVFFLWWLALVFLVVHRTAGASRRHALLVVSGLLAYTVAVNALT
jgi:hypothetical protein